MENIKNYNYVYEKILDNNVSECSMSIYALESDIRNELIDYVIANDYKIEIPYNYYRCSKYVKDFHRVCPRCGQTIKESDMRDEKVCPICGFDENRTESHKTFLQTSDFSIIINPLFYQETMVKEIKEFICKYNKDLSDEKKLMLNDTEKFEYLIEHESASICNHIMYINILLKKYRIAEGYEDKHKRVIEILTQNGYSTDNPQKKCITIPITEKLKSRIDMLKKIVICECDEKIKKQYEIKEHDCSEILKFPICDDKNILIIACSDSVGYWLVAFVKKGEIDVTETDNDFSFDDILNLNDGRIEYEIKFDIVY